MSNTVLATTPSPHPGPPQYQELKWLTWPCQSHDWSTWSTTCWPGLSGVRAPNTPESCKIFASDVPFCGDATAISAWCGDLGDFPPSVFRTEDTKKVLLWLCREKLKAWSTAMAQPVETTTNLKAQPFWMLLECSWLVFHWTFSCTWQSQVPILTTPRQ